jgi:hypothetical protein
MGSSAHSSLGIGFASCSFFFSNTHIRLFKFNDNEYETNILCAYVLRRVYLVLTTNYIRT